MRARTRLSAAGIALCVFLAALVIAAVRPSAAEQSPGDLTPDTAFVALDKAAAAAPEYDAPPAAAARPFSHILIRREASVPAGAALTLFVRASTDGSDWSRWEQIVANDDLSLPEDGPDILWSQIVDVGAVARFYQVRVVTAPAPDGALPELRVIQVDTVDATGGPPDLASMAAAEKSAGKPAVVSRSSWGSPDGQGSRARPDYYPVNHLVVHHTADPNPLYPGSVDWPARVRAIWSYHAISRGWGDIGYNYLIDPFGVIYEGRAGGDDAVAFHDTANYGSMGVAMLGTFQSAAPAEPTLDSLVRLLAWKADQKDIDPLGSSYYYGCTISKYCRPFNAGAVVPNIAGHRQVTPGHTTCPGDATMARMPDLRNRVKQLIDSGGAGGGGTDNGDLQVDELETSFARSPANWYESACGAGGHAFYTFGTDNPAESTNSGTWRPNIPQRARYRVYAHVPRGCAPGTPTGNAVYRIRSADGDAQRAVNQGAADGWVDLGAYTFDAGNGGAVELYDVTGEPLGAGRPVIFDAVKWVKEDSDAGISLVSVSYDRTSLPAGELLRVTFVVENTGPTTLYGQEPHVDLGAADGQNTLDNGYVYNQDECFAGNPQGTSPVFLKETDRFRVTLGTGGWDAQNAGRCSGGTSDYPWRWGLNAPLDPGQRQTIVGFVRMRTPGAFDFRAGVIQEYVKYHVQDASPTRVTVSPETTAPDGAAFDAQLRPLAHVYQLADATGSALSRASDLPDVPRGAYVGSFAWDGALLDWGDGGPLGLVDRFVVEQTRAFLAPAAGEYTFRTRSDDGSWLLVDGRPVVANGGLHALDEATGAVTLSAGVHTLTYISFDRGGQAAAGYDVMTPGSASFTPVIEGVGGGALRVGGVFAEHPDLVIAADDRGGSGVALVRWRWAGGDWQDSPGSQLRVGRLQNGSYALQYQPVDASGNAGPVRDFAFTVDTSVQPFRRFLPIAWRP